MNKVGLIDAGGANLGSVRYALERLGADIHMIHSPSELTGVNRLILPGVGAAAEGMQRLRVQGLQNALRTTSLPLLGICLGMQLLFEHCEEDNTPGLGLLSGNVKRLPVQNGIRVPHMGWNTLNNVRTSPMLKAISSGSYAYFVHSYAAPVTEDTVATCQHGTTVFAAAVQRGYLWGAQFHPERSAHVGATLLKNFLEFNFS